MGEQAKMRGSGGNGVEGAIETLAEIIARWTEQGERFVTAVPGLSLFRREEPTDPITGMYEPSICMVAQGAKRVHPWRRHLPVRRAQLPDHLRAPADCRAGHRGEQGEAVPGA